MKIQLKRVHQYEGSFNRALKHIKSLNLQPGEPFLCTYKENEEIRYFLAIGTAPSGLQVFPGFSDLEDFYKFVKERVSVDIQELFEEISEESQIALDTELGADGKPKIVIPDLL